LLSAKLGQFRESWHRAGNERDSGCGPHARPRGDHLGNPESRGYRAGLRSGQRPRRCPLCRSRRACKQQPRSHQHLGAGRAITNDARRSGVRRSRWPDVLWTKYGRRVSTRRRLCRQNSARGQAWRHSGRAADQVRSRHQSHDRQGARPHNSRIIPAARRRGDRMTAKMKRRDFISLVGGTAATLPLAARAQQPAMPVVGFVSGRSPGSDAYLVEGFRRGLRENGFTEGQNVALEFRWADGRLDRLPAMIAELIERKVTVLFAGAADVAAGGLRVASAIVPVVIANGSGGNLTGVSVITNTLWPKRIELLRDLLPTAPLIALLMNPTNLAHLSATRELNDAARKLGQEVSILPASVEADFETAFAALVEKRASALI